MEFAVAAAQGVACRGRCCGRLACLVWAQAYVAFGMANNVLRRACYRRRAPVPIKRRTSDDRGAAAKGSDDEGGTPRAGEGSTAAGEAGTAGVEIASEWAASGAQACCLRVSLCLTAVRCCRMLMVEGSVPYFLCSIVCGFLFA